MEPPKLLGIVLTVALLFQIALTAKQAVVSQKSKLCGNVDCDEVLFKSRVKRVMGVNNDPSFLNLAENAFISVVAVKFSDRIDIMEGKLNGEGESGFFYAGAIDIAPFAEFLRTAINEKKEMMMISQNPADKGDKRVVGYVHSETDLIRDYNAKNAQAAAENGLPPPEPLPIPEPVNSGHGHSHGGHGHSHGGHGHSHGHPAPTPAATPVVDPPKTPEVVPEAVTPAPEPVKTPEVVPEDPKPLDTINLNNVLGSPPKIDLADMDLEIERMIREESERIAQQQEPLVLKSLPAEPLQETLPEVPIPQEQVPEVVTPAPVPEVVPEVVTPPPTPAPVQPEPIAQYIQEPTTTSIPPVVHEEVPTPAPVIQDIPVPVEEITTTTTPAPVPQEPEQVAQVAPQADDLTGVCYKENCDGLQTPPPAVEAAPPADVHAHAHGVHGHSHGDHEHGDHGHSHGDHGHSHGEEAVEEPTTTPPPASAEEAEFLKWEEERRKREGQPPAQPYEDAQGHQFHGLPPHPPASAGLIELVRSSLGLGDISDASVLLYINLTFVIGALLFYVIVRVASSGSSDSDHFDRQAYFELVTKHKQLQLQLQAKNTETLQNHPQHPQQQQMPNLEPELMALRQQLAQAQHELQTAQAQRLEYETHYHQIREMYEQKEQQIVQLNEMINDYRVRLESNADEIQEWSRKFDAARAELNESQQSAYGREQETLNKQQEMDELQQKIHDLNGEVRSKDGRIQQLEQANGQLEIELEELRTEITSLLATIQHLEKELEAEKSKSNDAAESGGSGWSDIENFDDVEEKKEEPKQKEEHAEKTPDAEIADLRAKYKKYGEDMEELSKLRVKFEQAEKELARYRSLYEKSIEKENRGAIEVELKLKNAEAELLESKKKIEELTAEKKEFGDRLNEMLKNLNVTMTKSNESDKLVSTLREEMFAKDRKILEVEREVRDKADKVREVESEFKRLKGEYTKLETKSFHEVMTLKKELDDYKSAQILGGGSRDMFSNITARSGSRNDRLASPLEEPIWDEPEYVPNHLQQPPQELDYFSSGSMTMPSRRRSSRRSNLIGVESPSDQEKSTSSKTAKKDAPTHRRRSRSQGRQYPVYQDPYLPQYLPGSSDSSFMSMGQQGFQPLTGRHSKSGHLSGHYSSGGSNGGRSPPPEMPLLSAIPPPGARKPMSKRPDSAHHHGK
ncbi:unnamed protein product [Caenorhabditis brenneri]